VEIARSTKATSTEVTFLSAVDRNGNLTRIEAPAAQYFRVFE
jgi:hypothetical protein